MSITHCTSLRDLTAGEKEERELLMQIASSVDLPYVNLHLQPVRVAVWKDRGSRLEVGGEERRGLALPYSTGGVAEGRAAVDLANVEGEILLSNWPEDPDDAKFLVIKAIERGASGVVFCGGLRRIAVPSDPHYRDDYSLVKIPVISVDEPMEELIGKRVRIVSDVYIGRGIGYNLLALFGSPSYVMLSAHHDHWLHGALDNCSGVEVATRSFVEVVERLIEEGHKHGVVLSLFSAEECCGVNFPSFYWAWGSREFVRWLKNLDLVHAVINVDIVGRGVERAYSPEPLRPYLAGKLPTVDPMPHFDSVSFDLVGIPSATISGIHENMDVYHSPKDVPSLIDASRLDEVVGKLAEIVGALAVRGLDLSQAAGWIEGRLRVHGIAARVASWSDFRLAYSSLYKYVVEYRGENVEVRFVDLLEYLRGISKDPPDAVQVLGGPVLMSRPTSEDVELLLDYLRDEIYQELR